MLWRKFLQRKWRPLLKLGNYSYLLHRHNLSFLSDSQRYPLNRYLSKINILFFWKYFNSEFLVSAVEIPVWSSLDGLSLESTLMVSLLRKETFPQNSINTISNQLKIDFKFCQQTIVKSHVLTKIKFFCILKGPFTLFGLSERESRLCINVLIC